MECYPRLEKDKEIGLPDHLTCLLRNLYAGQEATVRTGRTGGSQWRDLGCKAKFSYTGCGKESQRPAGGGEGVPSGLNLKDEHTFPHEEEHSSSIDTQLVELRQR